MSAPDISRLFQVPPINPTTGRWSDAWRRYLIYWLHQRVTGSLDQQGVLLPNGADFSRAYANKHLDNIPDGPTYGRPRITALTGGNVDLSKSGVVGQVPSSKVVLNVMSNYSNNATVDSIDNGLNATIRVYGPGGPGTTWHQIVGSSNGPEIAAFAGSAPYNVDRWVYWTGSAYVVSATPDATYADGLIYGGALHTVSAGGGGGVSGGGGAGGGGGGYKR